MTTQQRTTLTKRIVVARQLYERQVARSGARSAEPLRVKLTTLLLKRADDRR